MFQSLATPAVLVDGLRLEKNIEAAQLRANEAGIALRPHVKTHRSVEIARRQLAAGAAGITCAKPSEAEVFLKAGLDDVRIAYPVAGAHRVARVLDLCGQARQAGEGRLTFCIDTMEGAKQVAEAFTSASMRASVLLKIDCGYGRAGWEWCDRDLADVVREISDLQGLSIAGVLTHAGQAYSGPGEGQDAIDVLRAHAANERDRTQAAAAVVGGVLGVREGALEVSVGSTPTFWQFTKGDHVPFPVTELRPGNYVFHDLTQVALGAVSLDQCALTVLATVVSARQRGGKWHALIDAGKKTFTADQRVGQEGFGLVLRANPGDERSPLAIAEGVQVHSLSEEHGWIEAPLDSSYAKALRVGQRVRVMVNHSCVVASTQRQLEEVWGDQVVGSLALDARGCSQ